MYLTSRTIIKKAHPLYEYCVRTAKASKCLYNAALFRLRNNFTGRNKENPTPNELLVQEEIRLARETYLKIRRISSVISYYNLDKIMRAIKNPDYLSGLLSMQTAEHVLQNAVGNMQNWISSVKKYKKDPSGYTGAPNMPGYVKGEMRTTEFTNQDCKYRNGEIKFPLTDITVKIGGVPDDAILKTVEIKPYYGQFLILCTFEVQNVPVNENMPYMLSADEGVNNLAAIVTNEGSVLLFKGGAVKAINQWFNKERARLVSELTKGHETDNIKVTSHALQDLSRKRDCFIRDYLHKVSSRIISFCLLHKIGTIIIGVNKQWKTCCNIGKVNNQNFVQIPFYILRQMITYKAQRAGITVIEQEESYTSKADFLCGDDIPVYGQNDSGAKFSGRRIKRGLYKSGTGIILNADINGAANIMKKAVPPAFDEVNDFAYFNDPLVVGFNGLNLKSNPVRGIGAV